MKKLNTERTISAVLIVLGLIGMSGCNASTEIATETGTSQAAASDSAQTDEDMPEAGILLPRNVRENLGITFATVERRKIAATRRVPGRFELRPEARHEYRALLPGRVHLAVKQFDAVDQGDLLFTINSPEWRQIQHSAVEAEGEIAMAEATRDVIQARLDESRALLAKNESRLKNLNDAGARSAQLETEAAALKSSIPRITAELKAQDASVDEAHDHYQSRLRILSSVTGKSLDELLAESDGEPAWRQIRELEVFAESAGTVEQLNVPNGGWLGPGEMALSTVDHRAVRFHAEAPQSDITYYKDGQRAKIVPSQGGSVDLQMAADGTLTLGLTAHPEERSISLYVEPVEVPAWARAGVSAFLEVTLTENAQEEWAIPLASVVQDGLDKIFYRRDPENPNRVLRVLADVGENDGRWVAVRSRVQAGDQVVLDGAYALKMSGQAQQAPEGYHYHADGTLHKNH